MLRFELRLVPAPGAVDEATQVLRSLVGPVRSEPGCAATRLLRDLDDAGSLIFVEEWRSRNDLVRHLSSSSFRRLLAVMELAARSPTVEIDEIAVRRGFDLVEELIVGSRRCTDDRATLHYQEGPGG